MGIPGWLDKPLAGIEDEEGANVPLGMPPVIDAHVHLNPSRLASAVSDWFSTHGWPIRNPLDGESMVQFLLDRGVSGVVGLIYAHRPGMAAELNTYMADLSRRFDRLTGLATVFPGENNAREILTHAISELDLRGVKLHAHVQGFDVQSAEMEQVYKVCMEFDRPLLMHVGREPKSPAYAWDTYKLCDAERLEKVVAAYPDLRICVPHLGADEFEPYRRLIETYDNLWLDTAMVYAEYFPHQPPPFTNYRQDRVFFGSDLPAVPYAWDRELKLIQGWGLTRDQLTGFLGANAAQFYGINLDDEPPLS